MFERVLNNTNSYFDESYSPQLLTLPLNLYIWCKIQVPTLNNSLSPILFPHSISPKLWKIKIFKDTLKAFDNFKNKQQKTLYEVMFSDM